MLLLTNEQVFERLRHENQWWATGEIDKDYQKMQKRLYFESFYSLVEDISIKRAVILMGPRRVGKTIMIYHAINTLIQNGINSHQIFYVSIENPFFNKISLEQMFKFCLSATGRTNEKGCYMFFLTCPF